MSVLEMTFVAWIGLGFICRMAFGIGGLCQDLLNTSSRILLSQVG